MPDVQPPNPAAIPSMIKRLLRSVGIGLLTLFVISIGTLLFSALLMHVFDDVEQFHQWREDNYGYLLAWRLTLYSVVTLFWLKLKARLSLSMHQRKRLRRAEFLVVLLLLLVELNKAFFQSGGQA